MEGAHAPAVDLWVAIGIVAVCIVLSAFFSGSETALTAASRARMHGLEKNGDPGARAVNRLLGDRERFIGAVLLGNTLANIGASAFTTNLLTDLFGDRGVLYATGIMTVLLLVFAEVLPKTIAINSPDQTALFVSRPIRLFVTVLGPVLVAVDAIVRGVLRLFGLRIGQHSSLLSGHEELRSAVDLLHKEGGVEREDRDMFGGLLGLVELTVEDVMVHRIRMRAIDADLPPHEIVREVLASPYTRLPLWRGEPDNIVGVIHAKDLLRAFDAVGGDATKLDMAGIIHEPWFVPTTTPLKDQLQEFLRRKTHFALVVDEYGVVMGLVTLEDILEEIVGDIKDEHDAVIQGLRHNPDGSVTLDGGLPIRDLNRTLDWHLPDEQATTVAGLVIHEAQLIPEVGQVFSFHGFRFEILRKARNRVTLMRITPQQTTDEDDSG